MEWPVAGELEAFCGQVEMEVILKQEFREKNKHDRFRFSAKEIRELIDDDPGLTVLKCWINTGRKVHLELEKLRKELNPDQLTASVAALESATKSLEKSIRSLNESHQKLAQLLTQISAFVAFTQSLTAANFEKQPIDHRAFALANLKATGKNLSENFPGMSFDYFLRPLRSQIERTERELQTRKDGGSRS